MLPRHVYKTLLTIQGLYILITAIWPLIDIESFMRVTGPKTDIWLVKTVAVLLIPISVGILLPLISPTHFLQSFMLGLSSAVGLAAIDFYYTINNTIDDIYMWDGILQCLFAVCWLYTFKQIYLRKKNQERTSIHIIFF
jgi:hypothetical protein